jgi:hypothetical protein
MPSQQSMDLKVSGLWLNPSQFAEVPPGALSQADNVVIDRESIATKRRGFAWYGNELGSVSTNQLLQYNSTLLAHTSDGTLWYDSNGQGDWIAYSGTYTEPSSMAGSRIRAIQANKSIFFTTNQGIFVTDTVTKAPFLAGAPQGYGGSGTTTGSSGWMGDQTNVAYRIVWFYTDPYQRQILGPPSERVIVTNNTGAPIATVSITDTGAGYTNGTYTSVSLTGGSGSGAVATIVVELNIVQEVIITSAGTGYRINDTLTATIAGGVGFQCEVATLTGGTVNVNLKFYIPPNINTTWGYQVYRSPQTLGVTDVPLDDLQLCYESNPASADITNGYITFTDVVPDDLLGAYIYTAPAVAGADGILQSYYRPPFAELIAQYKTYTFYANTRTLQTLQTESLVASGPTLGIQVGDTVTFTDSTTSTSFTMTGVSSTSPGNGQFTIYSTGNPALDIQNTSQSLVNQINLATANTFLSAYYTSDYNTLPGQFMFQKRTLDAGYFYMNSSRQTCWSPQVPASGTSIQSTNDTYVNRMFYSQELQPEAVPLLNYLDIGSANFPIQAMIPLRNGCLFFKEDGIFRLYGLTTPFTIIPLDFSARITAPNSAVVLNNLAFVLTDQGVIQCDESGAVQILSRPIENVLNEYTSPTLYPNFQNLCFAVGYNADRKYVLNLPTQSTDTSCTQQFVWNHITQTWTHWLLNTTCGIISDNDDKMYLGSPYVTGIGGYVLQERKSFNSGDYVDLQFPVTITGSVSNYINVNSTTNLAVGDVIVQSSLQLQSVITNVVSGTSIQVEDTGLPWATGPALIYQPINTVITSIQQDCKTPGTLKHFRSASFLFSETTFNSIDVTFFSDMSASQQTNTLTAQGSYGWGTFAWGAVPWGGGNPGQSRLYTLVPRGNARANWIIYQILNDDAFTDLAFSGVSLTYTTSSEREGTVNG